MSLARITAKWRGRCACCGARFEGGASVLHDAERRRCYLPGHEPEGAVVLNVTDHPAYRAGLLAGCAVELVACPYHEGTADHAMWMQGMQTARM